MKSNAKLEHHYGGYLLKLDGATDHTSGVLAQSDWDFISLAQLLGYDVCGRCKYDCKGHTDGSISCKRGSAGYFIEKSIKYLDNQIGRCTVYDKETYWTYYELQNAGEYPEPKPSTSHVIGSPDFNVIDLMFKIAADNEISFNEAAEVISIAMDDILDKN